MDGFLFRVSTGNARVWLLWTADGQLFQAAESRAFLFTKVHAAGVSLSHIERIPGVLRQGPYVKALHALRRVGKIQED